MTDITSLPLDTTPEDFFMEVLPEVLGEVDLPDGLGTERLQFHISGDEGIDIHIGIDEDGDLTLEEGTTDSPPIAISTSDNDFRSVVAGALRDQVKAKTGNVAIGPRQLRKAFMPESKVQRIKALSGNLQFHLIDNDDGVDYRYTVTLGGGTPDVNNPSCTVSLDVPTLMEIAGGQQQMQQLFFQGKVRIDGDMNIIMGLMAVVTGP